MDAVLCCACGERHWGLCEGAGDFVAERMANGTVPVENMANGVKVDAMINNSFVGHTNKTPSSTYKYRDPEKRRKSQRELMRKRRLKSESQKN